MITILIIIWFTIVPCYGSEKDDYELFKHTSSPNPHVTKLRINSHPDLKSMKGLRYFPNLTRLSIRDCPSIKDLDKSLVLHGEGLRKLSLCRLGLVSIPFIASLTNLEALNLGANHDLKYIHPLSELPKLRSLHLGSCGPIRDISILGQMTRLKKLCLSATLMQYPPLNPPLPTSLHFLEPLAPSLQYLDLRCCDLRSLSPLEKFHNLRYLYLNGSCDQTTKWNKFESLRKLEYFDLGNVQYRIRSYRFLETLPHLKKVYVQEEDKIPLFKKRPGLTVGSKVNLQIHEW